METAVKKLFGLLLLGLAFVAPSFASTFPATVVEVLAGDTIEVAYGEAQQAVLRLYGIDTPELEQHFGPKAKKFTMSCTKGLELKILTKGKDKEGRTWAVVSLPEGGWNLNERLVRAGMAWWDRRSAPQSVLLPKLEREARESKAGLWQFEDPVAPWEYRWDMGLETRPEESKTASEEENVWSDFRPVGARAKPAAKPLPKSTKRFIPYVFRPASKRFTGKNVTPTYSVKRAQSKR